MNSKLHVGFSGFLLASTLIPICAVASQPTYEGLWKAKMKLFVGSSAPVARGSRGIAATSESTVPFPDAEVGGGGAPRGGTRPHMSPGPSGNPNAAKEITVTITLKIHLNKEKVTGNLTFNQSGGGLHFSPGIPQGIHDGKLSENVLTFRTVSSTGATFSNYVAVLDGNKLFISREQVIDQGVLVQFTMLRGK